MAQTPRGPVAVDCGIGNNEGAAWIPSNPIPVSASRSSGTHS